MNANNTSIAKILGGKSLDDIITEGGIKASEIIDQVALNDNIQYHRFKDKPLHSHEYKGDPVEEIEYLREHSNYRELINEMVRNRDFDAIASFYAYTSGAMMSGQQYDGFSNMGRTEQEMTRHFDKYLDQATLDDGIVVSRRATPEFLGYEVGDMPELSQLKKMKGKVLLSRANLSTAVADQGLTIGRLGRKPIEYRIHIPGGTKGAGMFIGDGRINTWGALQREFMTNRDSLYLIGDTKETKRIDKGRYGDSDNAKVYVVNLYYIGRLPHDYS